MNENELIRAASRAAGEPVGEGDVDSAELAEFEHAVSVLRGAGVDPDADRRDDLNRAVGDQARIFKLYHFAAAAVVMFCIGLVVLFKVAMSGPADPIRTAGANNAPANTTNEQPEPDDPPEIADPEDETPPQPEYTRPEWIDAQVEFSTQELKAGLGGGFGGSEGSGGNPHHPRGGKIGAPPRGGGTAGSPGTGSGDASPPPTPLEKLAGFGRELGFTTLHWPKPDQRLKLKKVETVDREKSGATFNMVRVTYTGLSDRKLVILQAQESPAAQVAFDPEGLKGKFYTTLIGSTRVLLISNIHEGDDLKVVAEDLKPAE